MRLKFAVIVLAIFSASLPASAQWSKLVPVSKVVKESDGLRATFMSGAVLKLQVCSDAMIHVLYSPNGVFPSRPDYVVTKTSWPAAQFKIESAGKKTMLSTSLVTVTLDESSGSIGFSAGKEQLFSDAQRIMTPEVVNGEKTYRAEMDAGMYGSHEGFYGLGQHQAGVWNYHGESVDLSQENTNIAVPMLMSSKGYGIFWNNTSRSRVNNRFVHVMYISSEVADTIDYYFIYGPDFDKIVAGYRELTGAAPMFGRWAYGFWQCKNRYKSQEELVGIAQKYRDLHLPADNIVQDWFWWYTMGEPVFDKTRYPNPIGLVEDLHKNKFHLMISFWPYFRPGTKIYEDMDKRGFFIDKTKVGAFHPAGLPDTDDGAGRIGEHRHAPFLHHVHGLDHHGAAVGPNLVRDVVGGVHIHIGGPVRGPRAAHLGADARHVPALLGGQAVAAVLGAPLHDVPPEEGAVELTRLGGVRTAVVDPGRDTVLVRLHLHGALLSEAG